MKLGSHVAALSSVLFLSPSTGALRFLTIYRQIYDRFRWSCVVNSPANRGRAMASNFSESDKPFPPWKLYPSCQYDLLTKTYGVKNVKLIYMVRHAEGTHNVDEDYKSVKNMDAPLTQLGKDQCLELRDELLSLKKEIVEEKSLGTSTGNNYRNNSTRFRQGLEYLVDGEGNISNDICVVVSPLTRCIQTALLSFEFLTQTASPTKCSLNNNGNGVRFIGFEALRETVNYQCDRRRQLSKLSVDFPQIDFSFCQDENDEIWMSYRRRENSGEKICLESAELHRVADRGRQAMEFLQTLPQSKIVVCTHSAYLRCILNWGQIGGVPKMFDQVLDDREDPTRQDKIFKFCYKNDESGLDQASFEAYMRSDYKNAEMRSFCMLLQ